MSLLEAYATFGLPFILVCLGLGALLMQRSARRRRAEREAQTDVRVNWRPL